VPAPITGLYAALCGLLVVALAGRVIAIRRATKVGIGDGADRRLARAIRVHANAVEYVPIALILLLVAELGGAGAGLLHGCGIALVVGRIAHALGFTRTAGISFGRTLGVTLTFGVILVLAAVDAASFVR
jgi:uncharacterized membrane protein YecN with MAPEG domain